MKLIALLCRFLKSIYFYLALIYFISVLIILVLQRKLVFQLVAKATFLISVYVI